VKLAEHNRIYLIWVPEHIGINGNEMADQLAAHGSSRPLIGPKPALSIRTKVATEAIRDRMNSRHEDYWQSICGQEQAKGFLKRMPARKSWRTTQLE
jgi:hypothetical protein